MSTILILFIVIVAMCIILSLSLLTINHFSESSQNTTAAGYEITYDGEMVKVIRISDTKVGWNQVEYYVNNGWEIKQITTKDDSHFSLPWGQYVILQKVETNG